MRRFCAFVMSVLMSIYGTAFADGEYPEITASDNFKAYVNGEEAAFKIIPEQTDDYWFAVFPGYYYQFAPIARALGYEVSYLEESDSVSAVRGNDKIELGIGCLTAERQREELSDSMNFRTFPFVFDGATYLGGKDIEKLLEIKIFCENDYWSDIPEKINIYEYDYFRKIFEEKTEYFLNAADKLSLGEVKNKNLLADCEMNLDMDSRNFGMKLNGTGKLDLNVQFGQNYICGKARFDSNGIFNVLKLLAEISSNYWKDEFKADLERPVELDFYIDRDNFYLKSDNMMELLLYSDYWLSGAAFDKEGKLTADISGKWLKSENPYELRKFMKSYCENPEFNLTKSVSGELADSFVDSFGNLGYEKLMKIINEAVALFGEKHYRLSENADVLSVNYKLEDYKKLFEILEAEDELLKLSDFSMGTKTALADGALQTTGQLEYSLSNFPNPYGVEFGTLKLKATGKTTISDIEEEFEKPDSEALIKFEMKNNGE